MSKDSVDLRQIARLKEQLEQEEKKAERYEWDREQRYALLRKEFGITTIEEAEVLIETRKQEAESLIRQYREQLEQCEWKEKLSNYAKD